MVEKDTNSYLELFKKLKINSRDFVMIGNSLKSDIVPVIEAGGFAIHIPYHTTWTFERIDEKKIPKKNIIEVGNLSEIKTYL